MRAHLNHRLDVGNNRSSRSRAAAFACALAGLIACAKAGGGAVGSGDDTGGGAHGGAGGATGPAVNVGGFGGVVYGGDQNGNGDAGDMCNKLDVVFDKLVPTIMILVDRSSSMTDEKYGNANQTRWEVLKSSLLDPTSGLIKPDQADVRFGLVTFTSTSDAGTCPVLGQVAIALNNYDAINMYYAPLMTPANKGETPTGESIRAVTDQLMAYTEPGPKYIVLATDGDPDTCPGMCSGAGCSVADYPNYPRDPNCGLDRTVAAVQAAFGKGIQTFVIGLGSDVDADNLQAMANAGQGLPVVLSATSANWLQYTCLIQPDKREGMYAMTGAQNAKAYSPTDNATLIADLNTIINSVRSCKFMLKGTVDLPSAGAGRVVLDGMPLSYMDTNGWRMNTNQELEVLGTACDTIKSNGKTIDISFPCGVYAPPPK